MPFQYDGVEKTEGRASVEQLSADSLAHGRKSDASVSSEKRESSEVVV
jgi:hypothetical protein